MAGATAGPSGGSGVGGADLSSRLVDAIISDFPDHEPGTRPIHTVGIGVKGYFQPSDIAPRYSKAEQFAGPKVPVTVRFSNGSGSPVENDAAQDARGMAVKFHLASGAEADLIMMTLPVFFVQTPEQFLEFTECAQPEVVPRAPRWRKILDEFVLLRSPAPEPDPGKTTSGHPGMLRYANVHPFARSALVYMSELVTPTSYTRVGYHAVHTFRATDPEGNVRFVRLGWEPVAGVRPIDPKDADTLARDYLHTELNERLARQPARFILRMHVAGQGDVIDDPTVIWDQTQTRLLMGELVLTDVVADQEADCERLSFNPTRVVPGLECSDDPILAARQGAYEESCWRRGGTGCPITGGPP